jgi:hypothetical protein
VGAVALTQLAVAGATSRFSSVELGILAVDVVMLLGLLGLALRAERFWPIWAVAFHLISTAGHAVKVVDPAVLRWGYAFALAMWSYPMLALLAIGTWNHQRRVKRTGVDVSWSSSFDRSAATPAPLPTGSSRNSAA